MFRDISEMIRNHVLILKQSSVNDSLKNLKCKSKTRTTVFNSDMARTRHILTHYIHLRNGNGKYQQSLFSATMFLWGQQASHVQQKPCNSQHALSWAWGRVFPEVCTGILAWWHVQRQVRMLWVQNQGCSDITQRSIGECCRRCPRFIHFRHYVFWKPLL